MAHLYLVGRNNSEGVWVSETEQQIRTLHTSGLTTMILHPVVESVDNNGYSVLVQRQPETFLFDQISKIEDKVLILSHDQYGIPVVSQAESNSVDYLAAHNPSTVASVTSSTITNEVEVKNDAGSALNVVRPDGSAIASSVDVASVVDELGDIETLESIGNTKLDTIHTDLSAILTEQKDDVDFSETQWIDSAGISFTRRTTVNQDSGAITTTYHLLDGSTYVPVDPTYPSSVNVRSHSISRFPSNLVNVAQSVKSSSGKVVGFTFINLNTVPVYVKFYDATSVTVGATAIKKVYAVGAQSQLNQDVVDAYQLDFSTGVMVSATVGIEDSDSVSPSIPVFAEVMYV